VLLTRPAVIVALGAALAIAAALLIVALVERLDRRIAGVAAILRLERRAPLAEIPFIDIASSRALATPPAHAAG
jgi:hypothetical protein